MARLRSSAGQRSTYGVHRGSQFQPSSLQALERLLELAEISSRELATRQIRTLCWRRFLRLLPASLYSILLSINLPGLVRKQLQGFYELCICGELHGEETGIIVDQSTHL